MPDQNSGAPATGTEKQPAPAPDTAGVANPEKEAQGGVHAAEGSQTPSTPEPEASPSAGDATSAVDARDRPGTSDSDRAEADEAAYWAWLEKQDPDALVKRHRPLAGKIGELADKQAKRLREEERRADEKRQAEEARRQREQELDEAIDNDPYKLQDLVKEEREKKRKAQEAESHRKAVLGEWDARLERIFRQLPEEVQQALSGKQYGGGDEYEARTAFLEDVMEQMAEQRSSKKLTTALKEEQKRWLEAWEKERLPVLRQDWLSEVARDAPSPDQGGGSPEPGEMTWDEFQANRQSASWRRENRERIDRMLAQRTTRRK